MLDNVVGRHLDPDSASLLAANPIKRESLFLHIQSKQRVNTPQRSSIRFFFTKSFYLDFRQGETSSGSSLMRFPDFVPLLLNSILLKLKSFEVYF
jgi:hypothetical protein